MVTHPDSLLDDFVQALRRAGRAGPATPISHEAQPAPHLAHSLPSGRCAVYVFSLSRTYGSGCTAGANRILKVGKAGPKSNARFQSQHYNPGAAPSTLAASLVQGFILWPYLGLNQITEAVVGDWIRQNTDRDNFYLTERDQHLLGELERYLRGRLGPAFEGG